MKAKPLLWSGYAHKPKPRDGPDCRSAPRSNFHSPNRIARQQLIARETKASKQAWGRNHASRRTARTQINTENGWKDSTSIKQRSPGRSGAAKGTTTRTSGPLSCSAAKPSGTKAILNTKNLGGYHENARNRSSFHKR